MLINNSKTVVIKLGSSTVVDSKGLFKKKWVTSLIKDIKKYKKNINIVIVSSGAIALGQSYLKIKKKVKLEMSQAIASVGQIHLAGEFQKLFDKNKLKIGQILITPDDTEQRRRALNVRRTFENLFKLKAIPIVNENDTTATSEIKYGDNDRLAARVAQIIGADTMIIFSDVDGLHENIKHKKRIISVVKNIDKSIYSLADKKINSYGSGGMTTKLDAAKICMNSGCHMYIANGKYENPIKRMIEKKIYTCFKPKISSLDARKKWIISSLSSSAKIFIDDGAAKALSNGKSLLAPGILKVIGKFTKGENILIVDSNNNNLARGLSSFSSDEINKIKGLQSDQIEIILGYASKTEIIHKDDMVKL